jgi:ketosteroid isomerase-like protein
MTNTKIIGVAMTVLAAAPLVACSPPTPTKVAADTSKIAAAVKADADQLVADFNAHDAAKSVSHDAPGIVGMFHGAPNTVGADADLAATKRQAADLSSKLAVSDETIDVAAAGDMAIYRATYVYTSTDPKTKKPVTETGNWVVGYKPQPDGTWKIVWDVVSDTGPAPATPAPAAK